jgi:hypothetical protein
MMVMMVMVTSQAAAGAASGDDGKPKAKAKAKPKVRAPPSCMPLAAPSSLICRHCSYGHVNAVLLIMTRMVTRS